jgi:hypothetical protein
MTMTTGEQASNAAALVCPSCGDVYDTPERLAEVLRNSGFCANLTCLEDLSRLPIEEVLARIKESPRSADRRAV